VEPRARVSVWPGRRRVPGIVAPDSWGARGVECLPRDVLRRSSPATSPCDGTTARRCLCHGTGSGTTEARPPQAVYPGRLMGVWGFYRATWSIPGRIFGAQDKWCQFCKISGVSSVFNENRTDTTCFCQLFLRRRCSEPGMQCCLSPPFRSQSFPLVRPLAVPQATTGANTSAMRAGFRMPCWFIQESALSNCARPSSPPRISPRRRREAAA